MSEHERIALERFLAELDEDPAAEARAAAARIDELAREGWKVEGIERRFLPYFLGAGVLFVIGVVLFSIPGSAPRVVTIACVGALPVLAVIYGLRVIGRTRADVAADDLNRRHFLPHGGLYFAAGERPACVVRVAPQAADPRTVVTPGRKDYW